MAFTTLNLSGSEKRVEEPFTAQTSVVVDHNFGKTPGAVTFVDGATNEVSIPGHVIHNNLNRTTVTFGSPKSGKLVLLG